MTAELRYAPTGSTMFARFFKRKRPQPAAPTPGLGAASSLVLAKIGHDLRDAYEDVLQQPVTDEMRQALDHLPTKPSLKVVPENVEKEEAPPAESEQVLTSDRPLL